MAEERKIADLNPGSRSVDVTAKVVSIGPSKEVLGRDGSPHTVAEALIGDETGSILLTLWDDAIQKVQPGQTITIRNGFITIYKGSMRLNVGRYGSIEESDVEISEVNEENNMSERRYDQRPPRFKPLYKDRDRDLRKGRRGGRR